MLSCQNLSLEKWLENLRKVERSVDGEVLFRFQLSESNLLKRESASQNLGVNSRPVATRKIYRNQAIINEKAKIFSIII